MWRGGFGFGVGTGLVIPYPYPYPTFGYRDNPYPVNSDITCQSRDGFGRVPTGTGFLAMSSRIVLVTTG